jgi:predicted RNA-binding protein
MIGNEDNWKRAVTSGFWAVGKGRKLARSIRKGDKIIAYLSLGPCAFFGIFRATSNFYYDNMTPVFGLDPRKYAYRVNIAPEILLEEPLSILPLIQELNFIKDPHIWGAYFQQSIIKIEGDDFEKILLYIKTKGRFQTIR